MWKRKELKRQAKQNLKRYHWRAVAVCVIIMILQTLAGSGSSGGSSASIGNTTNSIYNNAISSESSNSGEMYGIYEDESLDLDALYNNEDVMDYLGELATSVYGWNIFTDTMTSQLLILGILLGILRILLNFFIVNPIMVGQSSFFYKNRYEKTSIGELAFAFNREDLFPVVKTMFLRDLYIVLWSFLLIIPGIVKSYAYRMVPFILSEYPQMPAKEAIRLSSEMTRGHKWKMFVLDFSFFGWYFLGAVSFGIVNVLYTMPYVYATEAELYDVLKQPFRKESVEADVF